MTKQERVAERHSNIEMLSDLLEASLGYDKRAQDCAAKKNARSAAANTAAIAASSAATAYNTSREQHVHHTHDHYYH